MCIKQPVSISPLVYTRSFTTGLTSPILPCSERTHPGVRVFKSMRDNQNFLYITINQYGQKNLSMFKVKGWSWGYGLYGEARAYERDWSRGDLIWKQIKLISQVCIDRSTI